MDNLSIQQRFRSIIQFYLQLSFSLIELICILILLSLQIVLTTSETCLYRISVVYWSSPFLFISPLAIWLLLHQRNGIACLLAVISHFISTLFATGILIVSFLALLNISSLSSNCSSTTNYFLSMNVSILIVTFIFKVFLYIEMVFLWIIRTDENHFSIIQSEKSSVDLDV